MALMRVLNALNRPLDEEAAERLIDEAGDKGIDMLRLKELAEQHGVHALGIAVRPEELRQLGQPAIVLLDGVGFVPVLGFVKASSFTYAVEIKTNEPEGRPARIPVRGYLEQPVTFNPPAVLLRDVLAEEKAEAEVQVDLPRRMDLSSLKLTAPKEGPLRAELIRQGERVALKVRWAGAKQPGIYRGEFAVRALDAEDAVASTLPVAVEVVPEITVFPPSLWIEAPAGGQWTRQLSIESKRELVGTPALRWSDEAAGKVIQSGVTRESTRALRVKLSGKISVSREPITLTISTGDQSVSIPLRFVRSRD